VVAGDRVGDDERGTVPAGRCEGSRKKNPVEDAPVRSASELCREGDKEPRPPTGLGAIKERKLSRLNLPLLDGAASYPSSS
jgi:hypothetical protein